MAESAVIKAICHCRLFSAEFSVPKSSLPSPAYFCHCDTCRQVSGQLWTSYARLPTGITDAQTSNLCAYDTSQSLTRYFCPQCGAHVLCKRRADGQASITTGCLETVDNIIRFEGHEWLPDDPLQPFGTWISSMGGRQLGRFAGDYGESQSLPLRSHPEYERSAGPAHLSMSQPTDDQKLHGSCHCRAVQFYTTRPSSIAEEMTVSLPDLIAPFHSHKSGSGGTDKAEESTERWWVRGERGSKYLAGTCACTSCRLTSGFDIQSWAFVPRSNIFDTRTGNRLFFPAASLGSAGETGRGGLESYESSPGTHREFCGTCGATVFWHSTRRPQLIDVSVGLLQPSPGSSLSRDWLEWWTARVSFREEALNGELVRALEKGLKSGAESHNGI